MGPTFLQGVPFFLGGPSHFIMRASRPNFNGMIFWNKMTSILPFFACRRLIVLLGMGRPITGPEPCSEEDPKTCTTAKKEEIHILSITLLLTPPLSLTCTLAHYHLPRSTLYPHFSSQHIHPVPSTTKQQIFPPLFYFLRLLRLPLRAWAYIRTQEEGKGGGRRGIA